MGNSRARRTRASRRLAREARVARDSSRRESQPVKADRSSAPTRMDNARQERGPKNSKKLVAPRKEPVGHNRLRKLSIPIALFVIGCALCAWAYLVKPSRGDVITPATAYVLISSPIKLTNIRYTIMESRTSYYSVDIIGETHKYFKKRAKATVYVAFSNTTTFVPHCADTVNCQAHVLLPDGVIEPGISTELDVNNWNFEFDFTIKSPEFAFSYNGVEALALLPHVEYQGPGSPIVNVLYDVPDGSNYDWSSLPPAVNPLGLEWDEPLAFFNQGSASEMSGTNHVNGDRDDSLTFLAGALVGVGGAALIGALQEALHLWPRSSDTDRRRSRSLDGAADERS